MVVRAQKRTIRRLSASILLMVGAAQVAAAQSEVSPFCATVYKAAASAVANRASGHSETQLRAALPARNALTGDSPDIEIARVLHEILDEVYGAAPLAQSAYAVYRTEVCVRQEGSLARPLRVRHGACGGRGLRCAGRRGAD